MTINWNIETSLPLNFAGEISAIYKGTAKEDTPIAIPRNKRAKIKFQTSNAIPDQIAPTTKITAEANITFLRPSWSVILPQNRAPKIAPNNPTDVTNSIILLSIPKSFWKNGIAPETTPVSKPKSKPPVAAIIAII